MGCKAISYKVFELKYSRLPQVKYLDFIRLYQVDYSEFNTILGIIFGLQAILGIHRIFNFDFFYFEFPVPKFRIFSRVVDSTTQNHHFFLLNSFSGFVYIDYSFQGYLRQNFHYSRLCKVHI